jgi:8-oxo-dGTP diphosphatase
MNREFPAWMGCWNGVGGKLEAGESPRECIIREIHEETGLDIADVQFKGIESWFIDNKFVGGMYLYVAELPNEQIYLTPKKTNEGILDWKECDWIINSKNMGVASDIPVTLKPVLFEKKIYEHRCLYKDGKLVEHQIITIDKDYELLENKKGIEEEIIRR